MGRPNMLAALSVTSTRRSRTRIGSLRRLIHEMSLHEGEQGFNPRLHIWIDTTLDLRIPLREVLKAEDTYWKDQRNNGRSIKDCDPFRYDEVMRRLRAKVRGKIE